MDFRRRSRLIKAGLVVALAIAEENFQRLFIAYVRRHSSHSFTLHPERTAPPDQGEGGDVGLCEMAGRPYPV